jgi:repressor LexA
MEELTRIDRDILRVIESFSERSRNPSLEEIGKRVGLAKSNVHEHLADLQKRGYVKITSGKARTIQLLLTADGRRYKPNVHLIPLCGTITAGEPIPLPDARAPLDWIEVARAAIADADNVFALRVQGNSMIDALVHDGDIVLLRNSQNAHDGDSVAARILQDPTNPQTTLKEFHREKHEIRLQPRNPTMQAKWYKPRDIEIMGIVIYVLSARPHHLDD